jgi:GTP-binding protein HflX
MEPGIREKLMVAREQAVLVACLLPNHGNDPHDPLAELRALADTAGATVVDEVIQNRQRPDPATFMGSGKVQEVAQKVAGHGAKVVIFDNDLSPSQIGNVEKVVGCKVLDRSELILDIFAARAKAHEARLQVELAQLEYTYPRLRAMWTHLERIVGGTPVGIGTRGPGEQQLELDRRLVQRKKSQLRRQIAHIQGRKRREVQTRNEDYFTVGVVGYTNAGKSTLFNFLTEPSGGGGAYADDKLFATLSTRTRRWDMGGGDCVMLSDTVGFVRDLPHHLVASFRATLEEAVNSDLLLVVLDVADHRAEQQMQTVIETLEGIGASQQPRIVVLNKIDLLEHNAQVLLMQNKLADALPISAGTGEGIEQLRCRVHEAMRGRMRVLRVEVDMSNGKLIQFLESRMQILERQYEGSTATYTLRIGDHQLERLRSMGGGYRIA